MPVPRSTLFPGPSTFPGEADVVTGTEVIAFDSGGPNTVSRQYSGIVINQNIQPGAGDYFVPTQDRVYQEFFLPSDFRRGTDSNELRWPDLTGFQLAVEVPEGYEDAAAFDWTLEYKVFGSPWIELDHGTAAGAHAYGERVWMNAYFNSPVAVDDLKAASRWRIGIQGNGNSIGQTYRSAVPYDGQRAIVNGTAVNVTLTPDRPYPFTLIDQKSILIYDSSEKAAFYSIQQGPTKIWFSTPNPLATSTAWTRTSNGSTQLGDFSFLFRILALTADEGVDFLGNRYRSVVVTQEAENASALRRDTYWLSKPNPSRFAVESLYFDMRVVAPTQYDSQNKPLPVEVTDASVVIDRILIDPLTPGMYFHVYYSNDGDLPVSEEGWDQKLWQTVPKTFQAVNREVHILPTPISAKFVKVEFSHLQARSYNPGDFAKSVTYKKHPQWVLNYFLARLSAQQATEDDLGIRRVGIVYDALSLAYDYYLDDLSPSSDIPVELDGTQSGPVADQVDPAVLSQINLSLEPYRNNPSIFAKSGNLLGDVVQQINSVTTEDYPIEQGRVPGTPQFAELQTLRNESVVFENDFPVMFFYLTCRHGYRLVSADFSHNRAYFAGINEIAFTRENYVPAHDNTQYIEPGADLQNIERNDFSYIEGSMVIE